LKEVSYTEVAGPVVSTCCIRTVEGACLNKLAVVDRTSAAVGVEPFQYQFLELTSTGAQLKNKQKTHVNIYTVSQIIKPM